MNKTKKALRRWKTDRLVAKRKRKADKRDAKLENRMLKRRLMMKLVREMLSKQEAKNT